MTFELRPVAVVGVTGVVTGHFGGQFCVELVGGFGGVARSGGLADSCGEGVLRQAVVGCLLGILVRGRHGRVAGRSASRPGGLTFPKLLILLDDAGPTPTPIGRVPLDVIRYIAAVFLSEASAARVSRSQNSGVCELSEPEGGHPA